jgi:hypothetical protein
MNAQPVESPAGARHRDLIRCVGCAQRFIVPPQQQTVPKHLHPAVPAVWCEGREGVKMRPIKLHLDMALED